MATLAISSLPQTGFRPKSRPINPISTPFKPRPGNSKPRASANQNLTPVTGFKVAILGAAGAIGQPLSLLLKMSPLISTIHLYDITNSTGVSTDLSQCNTPAHVLAFTGQSELATCLRGVDLIVIPAGVRRKPGFTEDELFKVNAGILKTLIEYVADISPEAFIHILTEPVNSTVPIAAEILKQKGVYNAKKLFGVTTLNVIRANTLVSQKKNVRIIDVDVPVIGGQAGITVLPLFSKTRPAVSLTEREVKELTLKVQREDKVCLSMAYASARFIESTLRAIDGDTDVYECSYVESELITGLPFFGSRVKMGKRGVEAVISSDLRGLSEFELRGIEELKPKLRVCIERGFEFVHKHVNSNNGSV